MPLSIISVWNMRDVDFNLSKDVKLTSNDNIAGNGRILKVFVFILWFKKYIIFLTIFPVHVWVSSPFNLFDLVLLVRVTVFYSFKGLVPAALLLSASSFVLGFLAFDLCLCQAYSKG